MNWVLYCLRNFWMFLLQCTSTNDYGHHRLLEYLLHLPPLAIPVLGSCSQVVSDHDCFTFADVERTWRIILVWIHVFHPKICLQSLRQIFNWDSLYIWCFYMKSRYLCVVAAFIHAYTSLTPPKQTLSPLFHSWWVGISWQFLLLHEVVKSYSWLWRCHCNEDRP